MDCEFAVSLGKTSLNSILRLYLKQEEEEEEKKEAEAAKEQGSSLRYSQELQI